MVIINEKNYIDLNKELENSGYSTGRILDLLGKHNWDYKKAKNGNKVLNVSVFFI